ncbi:hypothetical protein [Jeotgalibacillus haloalkalitolerans]|uniref:Transcription initiation factor TFIIIB n=1 Tax=Jeotgalibacillus haloalkalitolerans TaxID=3104292 RepID=A0ABU5KHD4_9BACL|nr:hypothetical protein [Jeotgalibacillus sp. HH7-29]MDZ5710664.1 hypothetical protein [Jeotgalibacillus sp. HH7-29]
MTRENFKCEKCGHTESKTGKIGNNGYDKIRKPDSFMSFGTSMYIFCCAKCGDVFEMKIESPERL